MIKKIDKDPTILNKLERNPNSVRSIQDDAMFVSKIYFDVMK